MSEPLQGSAVKALYVGDMAPHDAAGRYHRVPLDEWGAVPADVLLSMARDRSVAGRNRLVGALTDLIDGQRAVLSDREWRWMADILKTLLHEIEVPLRRRLAGSLASIDSVPRELCRQLAHDAIEIARPILQDSRVLADEDLIEVVLQRSQEHALAIARRRDLSQQVTDVLVDTEDKSIIMELLRNPRSTLSLAAMDYITEEAARFGPMQEPLLRRWELPRPLAKRLLAWVSASLHTYITRRWKLDTLEVQKALDAVSDTMSREIDEEGGRPLASSRLIDQLASAGLLSVNTLLRFIHEGHTGLFFAGLKKVSALRPVLMRRLVLEESGEGLAIMAKAIGATEEEFARLYVLTRGLPLANFGTSWSAVVPRDQLQDLVTLYRHISADAAMGILRRWRHDADYQTALRSLLAVNG